LKTEKGKVVLNQDPDYSDWLVISCPYETHFIKSLKTIVDPSQRWWDKEKKVWHVRSAFISEILPLFRKYYDEVECRVNVREILATTQVNVFSQLFNRISPQYADRIYKSLAKVVHPDTGGDSDLMKQLNTAYQERVPMHGAVMDKKRY
jgi:hypothetical protein